MSIGATRIIKIVLAVLGIGLAIAMSTVAGPCVHEDGSVSVCYPAGQFLLYVGIAAGVLSIIAIAIKSQMADRILFPVVALCGILAAALPGTVLPLCSMAMMRCNTIMHPTGIVFGIIIAVVALIGFALAMRSQAQAK